MLKINPNIQFNIIKLIILLTSLSLSAQTSFESHDFNNGSLGDWNACTLKSPNYTAVENGRAVTYWSSVGYDGSRSDRGAEGCNDDFTTFKEGWYGVNLEIGTDYSRNVKAGLAQVFGWIPGFWTWEAMLQIDNGDLTIVHRSSGGTSQNTEEVVYADFPFGQEFPIVIHYIMSDQNKGVFEIWVDEVLRYQKTNINFGFGTFDNNDIKVGNVSEDFGSDEAGSFTTMKFGQYNFDTGNYITNETRTVYYDDISWYNGSNGYDIVNPVKGSAPSTCGDFDAFSTIQAANFCDEDGVQITNGNVGFIEDGDWIKFEDVDFDNGAVSFDARVSSGNSGGNIELRTGSSSGTLIGTCTVNGTGGWTNWVTESCAVNGVSGVQDLYLVFTGGSSYLMDIDWFTFTEGETTTSAFIPDPNKTYYIDSAHFDNTRLAASGESENPYIASTTTSGEDVEWKFVAKGNGYWFIQLANGGSKPRLRSNNSSTADMQATSSSGDWTHYEITEGAITGSYFLTLPDGPGDYVRLQIDNRGSMNMVEDTRNGTWESFIITEAGTTERATNVRLEAEDYNSMSGIQTEGTIDNNGGENVGWINNGDWLRFDDIDLSGLSNMDARIACNFSGGTIELRTGSATGTLIGSINITNTGGNQSWVTENTSISNVNGTQDIYLVFTGGNGYLFNINWIEFNNSSQSNKDIVTSAEVSDVLIYPNPVITTTTIANATESIINIYDITGSVVFTTVISSESEVIDLSKLATGIYYGEVQGLLNTSVVKIIKE